MSSFIVHQPQSDSEGDLSNATAVAETGLPQEICGLSGWVRLARLAYAPDLVFVPYTIWSDDFSSYADTSEMLAAGWTETSGSALLDSERLRLDASAESAVITRVISGISAGDVIRATFDVVSSSISQVEFRATPTGSTLVGVPGTAGTGLTFTYTVDEETQLYFVARRNMSAGATFFIDNVVIDKISATNP